MHVIKHPRRLVESVGVPNLGLFLGLCGGLFYRQSEMGGPLAQQRGLAETGRGRVLGTIISPHLVYLAAAD